jgi:hypothetical protein
MSLTILVGCEESQAITMAYRKQGHKAYSCDILPCSGGFPEYHLQMDIFKALDLKQWDIVILHPPCRFLAVSGNRWYGRGQPDHYKRLNALKWTLKLWRKACAVCDRVAMENPKSVLSSLKELPKPQYIQPYQFGHGEQKLTALWLHGLPELIPTNEVPGRAQRIWLMPPGPERSKERSKTYAGIAEAIAGQWV